MCVCVCVWTLSDKHLRGPCVAAPQTLDCAFKVDLFKHYYCVLLFQYSGDQEDKVWLHEQKLMPATGGKAYMLLVEDIVDLSKSDEYK